MRRHHTAAERSWVFVLWLGVIFLVAQSVALATLPDPTWIPGMYASGDFDDQTAALVATFAVVDVAPVLASHVTHRMVALVIATNEGAPARLFAPSADPRGPPLASLAVSHLGLASPDPLEHSRVGAGVSPANGEVHGLGAEHETFDEGPEGPTGDARLG